MQKNGYPRYEITIPQRTRHRRDTGHGPGRGIGQGSSATAPRYPAQYQARAGFRHRAPQRTRHRPELRPAGPFSAPAAACRSVIRPGYSARTRPAPQDRRANFHPEFPIRPEFGHHVKHALPRTFAQHRRIHAPRTVQGTGTSLETEVVLPSRTHDFATNALQFVYFHKKPVQIPFRRLEQTAVESERSSMHAVYGARTEQHLPLLRLQIGNPLLESAKPTLQILHTYYNQSGGRTLFAASGEAKIKK